MNSVCVIGHYGFGEDLLNGQTIKTKIITEELERNIDKKNISKIDTYGGRKALFKLFVQSGNAVRNSKNIIILPANYGLKFFVPILVFWKKLYKSNVKLHYVVIGGWLPEYIKDKIKLSKYLNEFDCIFVETKSMASVLRLQGFTNVRVMPNCKNLKVLKANELIYGEQQPYRLCTFSRVMKEKGIEDAVEAVKSINRKFRKTIFTLDIFGQVELDQTDWFNSLKVTFPEYIRYCGIVPYDKSVDVLKNYFALLFPTYYEGEGFAGTLIDALASGIPVIASDWRYNSEIIECGVTGLIYKTGDEEALLEQLIWAFENSKQWNLMKRNCIERAINYMPSTVIRQIIENLA